MSKSSLKKPSTRAVAREQLSAMAAKRFAKGGEVSADEDEDEKGVGEVGSAQELLAQLESRGPRSDKKAAPALKRLATQSGGASMPKVMDMSPESLASTRELVAMAKDKGSARQQMEELARLYQLKLGAAQNRSRGLAASTFEAPTLEGTTLTKNTLATKRFKEGGEAKQDLPSVLGVRDYATEASGRLFPDQGGQDDQRDAARHMLAGAAMAKKYGPNAAKLLGLAHEYSSNPQTFFSGLGIGQPRDDFEYDEHNNRVGMGLASRATSREELEALVREMAAKASTQKREGRPWIMGQEKMDARSAKAKKGPAPRPEYRSKGSPEEGEFADPEASLFGGRDDVPAPAPARNKVLDEILGAGETALTLGTGAAASLVGMPYGLYKGITGGNYGKRAGVEQADREALAFIERNTYQPRLESGRENLAAIAKIADRMKLAPTPGGAALASLARPSAVKAQVERLGMAAEKKLEGPVTRTLEKGGKAADLLRSFETQPSRAVRPTGSTLDLSPASARVLDNGDIIRRPASPIRVILDEGKAGAGVSTSTPVLPNIQQFWDKKARNYFERQFGTPDDPIADALISGKIKGDKIGDIENFPSYITEATLKGKTREREVSPGVTETRFFPEFPKAIEDLTRRYDTATGLEGRLVTQEPGLTNPNYTNITSNLGEARERATSEFIEDQMIGQGVRPELINTQTRIVARSEKDPTQIIGPDRGKKLLEEYEKSLRGEATDLSMSTLTAIQKGEPIYDVEYMRPVVKQLFDPARVNKYLETLPPREIDSMRFEDVITNTNKMFLDRDSAEALVARIKSGKRVPDSVFSKGVSQPLLSFDKDSGLEGFAWKRIEERAATIPEGAYVGHSVGGYELGGAGYPKEKMDGFNTGKWQVYTLRDNRNRPVNTIEVFMLDEDSPVVTQVKGDGRATGNTAPVKYDKAVLDFFDKYLKPVAIQEKDELLTPLLLQYKNGMNAGFKMP